MPQPSFGEVQNLPQNEFDRLYRAENEPARRSLDPIEMAALITATVETWKFRVEREGPFGVDFPSICDVASELYLAFEGIPVAQGMAPMYWLNTEPQQLDPIALAAALSATVEVWKVETAPFSGYHGSTVPQRAPIEDAAKRIRGVIDVLTGQPPAKSGVSP